MGFLPLASLMGCFSLAKIKSNRSVTGRQNFDISSRSDALIL